MFSGCAVEEAFYSVTYDNGSADATGSVTDTTLYAKGNVVSVLGLEALEQDGFVVVGWKEESGIMNLAGNSRSVTKYDTSGDSLYNEGSSFNMPASNVVLVAQWDPEAGYSITYNLDGGENSTSNPENYFRNSEEIVLADAVKDDLVFTGWYTDLSDVTTKVSKINPADGTDVILYASYSDTYYITYDVGTNGINNANNPGMYSVNTTTIELQDPSRSGYLFDGWYTTDGDQLIVDGLLDVTGMTVDFSIYAKWIAIYSINYTLGDNGINNEENPSSYLAGTTTIEFQDPSRSGYHFDGWYTTDGDQLIVDGLLDVTGMAVDFSIYAKWTAIDFSLNLWVPALSDCLVYDILETIQVTYGDNYTVPSYASNVAPTGYTVPTGYSNDGWWTKRGTTDGIQIDTSSVVSYSVSNYGNFDLYLRWIANPYDVTFTANGGVGNDYTQEIVFDSTEALEENNGSFTNTGYTFSGWATTSTGVVSYSDGDDYTMATEGATLYAVWAPKDYAMTFNANGGAGSDYTQDITFTETDALEANSFTRTGYTFSGWATTSTGVVSYSDGDDYTMATEGATLYAVWTAVVIDLTFDFKNGEALSDSYPTTANYDSVISPWLGAKSGNPLYTFSCWIDEDNNTWAETDLVNNDRMAGISEDKELTLYAVYILI
jgi:uncharacterized repeat protein (TIGR02543 family)